MKRAYLTLLYEVFDMENVPVSNFSIICNYKRHKTNILDWIPVLMEDRTKHFRIPGFYENWVSVYLETDFFSHFRMTWNSLNILATYIAPLYVEYFNIQHYGGATIVPVEKCLMMTLWYLGKNDTLISISDRFDVAISTTHRIVNQIIQCINKLLNKFIRWPSRNEAEILSKEFYEKAKYPNVIGAIDGCHVTCKIPIKQHDSYQDRKFNHSITIQGICTEKRFLIDVSIGWPGSIHDARILRESHIGRNILNNNYLDYFYDDKYHLIGDSAYALKSWIMVPYRDTGRLNQQQKRHNYAHSVTRVVIENCFGLLKGRWRILQFVNVYSIEKAVAIITACCVLHNFCLINKDEFIDFENELELDDINYSLPNNDRIDIDGSIKRDLIASNL